jgi:hypothetical protein
VRPPPGSWPGFAKKKIRIRRGKEMSFRKLTEMCDKNIREQIGEFYFISKSRMDNFLTCLESGAKRISEMSDIIADQQEQIKNLQNELLKTEEN